MRPSLIFTVVVAAGVNLAAVSLVQAEAQPKVAEAAVVEKTPEQKLAAHLPLGVMAAQEVQATPEQMARLVLFPAAAAAVAGETQMEAAMAAQAARAKSPSQ